MFAKKIIEDNKILISNLKARMFRGYHKIAKKSKSLSYNKNNNFNPIYTPQKEEKDKNDPYIKTYTNRFPTKINREIFPFEYDYQELYKKKYLNKYNNVEFDDDFQVKNLSKNKNKLKKKATKINIYLTENKNCRNYIKKKEINKNNDNEQILNILFPYKEEIKKFSNLPFFSLTKNPYNLENDLSNLKSRGENNIKNLLQEDFLYKISHKKDNNSKYINNNFIKNKGVKKGKTIPFNDINQNSNKKIKLQLDIQNINKNKQIYLNSKEKRYKILEKEMEPLKNIVSLIKDFENNFLEEDNNNIEDKNFDKSKNVIINQVKNVRTDITQNFINERNFDEIENASCTTYNFKKPKYYPINFYSFNQLKRKEKKYENIHKLAFEEHLKKINLKDENIGKELRKNQELDEYEKQYFNKLFNKKEMTHKIAYNRECRIRDIILTNKLKCEFSPYDIKRLLSGLKPWNDCEKLDQKFLMKKLPKSVEDFTLNYQNYL